MTTQEESDTVMGGFDSKITGNQEMEFEVEKQEEGVSVSVSASGFDVQKTIDGSSVTIAQEVEVLDNTGSTLNGSVLVNCLDDNMLIDQEKQFRVGDFVWAKIRDQKWWPGQIYDPKDASDISLKYSFNEKNRLLVAFFGDHSCAWCLPTQVIPFVEKFDEKSTGSKSRRFRNSVQSALDEIGRNLESEMLCKCIPEEHRDRLSRPMLGNVGVKESVLRPNIKLPQISSYGPLDVFHKSRRCAQNVALFHRCTSQIEVTVLKSWISGFYRSKGGHFLHVYPEPVFIEGLEQKSVVSPLNDDDSPLKLLEPSDAILHKRNRSVAESNSDDNENLQMVNSARERKPSKYLSFPYTGLTHRSSRCDKISKKPRIEKKPKEKRPGFDMEEKDDDFSVNVVHRHYVFPLFDVSMPSDEFLSAITLVAVDPKCLKDEDFINSIRDFESARKSATYLNGEFYDTFNECKKAEEMPCEVVRSCDNELVTDAKTVTNKVELMTTILGRYSSDFSSEDKLKIKEAMKNLMQALDSMSEMVEASGENVRINTENGSSS